MREVIGSSRGRCGSLLRKYTVCAEVPRVRTSESSLHIKMKGLREMSRRERSVSVGKASTYSNTVLLQLYTFQANGKEGLEGVTGSREVNLSNELNVNVDGYVMV